MNLAPAGIPDMTTTGRATRMSGHWPYAAALVLSAIFWLLAWYWDTARSVVAIWERSETFAHGYLILPICAWLIWRERDALASVSPRPGYAALPLLALVGFGWLAAQLAGVGVVQQYCLALMISLLVWAILGNQIAWTLAFALLFLLFAVPFGEFLVPPLMEQTADFTVAALRLTGIPVYREGLFFTIPSGSWSVVEACSGLRYLIASLTLGVLYAYLTYRSWLRRAVFVVFAVIVPIAANWLRAYMIVMIGHLSGMKYAVGVDHLLYGWVFFGVVMMLLFWIGSFWREDTHPLPAAAASARNADRAPVSLALMIAAVIAAAAIVSIWPAAAERLAGSGPVARPALQVPEPSAGWQLVAGRLSSWTPRFQNPRAQFNQFYAKDAARAGLYIGYYRSQQKFAALITSQNLLVADGDGEWGNIGETRRDVTTRNEKISSIESKLRSTSTNLLVWRWYWVDGQYTASPYVAKLLQAKSMLLGNGDDGAVIIVYAPYADRPQAAEQAMQDFISVVLPAITRSLENARGAQPGS